MAGPCAGGQLAQARPALREERAGARLVAVERSASASSLVYDVELDLGAGLLVVGEQRRGLQREVPQRVVESTVTHAARFRRGTGVSCRRAPDGMAAPGRAGRLANYAATGSCPDSAGVAAQSSTPSHSRP